jgi:hypothetical protein
MIFKKNISKLNGKEFSQTIMILAQKDEGIEK